MGLNGHFPEAKFVREASAARQLEHVISETIEVAIARINHERINRVDEEMADLLHSCETYFRIRELEGVDIAAIFEAVVEKNRARGYYEPKFERCQTCHNIYCQGHEEYAVECRTNFFSYHQAKGDL